VLVVDDEPLARTNLTVLLRKDPEIELIDECGSGPDAAKAIRGRAPHIVFLDVQMPECDGFDVLEMLGGELPPAIIFVTAYDQYALRAFEAGALDYLLKPFDTARFELALKRAKEKVAVNAPQKLDRITVKSAGEILFLKLDDIDWIEAADYYACLHVSGKSHLLRRSLSDLEQELSPTAFCRIHRSTIVNLDRIRGLKLNADGDYDVLLDRGIKLRLSRRYRKQLRWRMGLRHPADPERT
jgi:two-component system LytT family response regulator